MRAALGPSRPLTRLPCLDLVLLGALLLAPACSGGSGERETPDQVSGTQFSGRRPNVVVLLADDTGYADFSFRGSEFFLTPRIDSIAAAGVRCTDAYVTSSVCSPSRAGLLTGRYQQRFGHEFNLPHKYSDRDGLPVGERTLADLLRDQGYPTLGVGKWHLGYTEQFRPLSRGFDHFFGFLQGSRSYKPLPADRLDRMNRLVLDDEVMPEDFEYLTDEFGERAAAFIHTHHAEPFFLYVAFSAVHVPLNAKPAVLERVTGLTGKRQKLAAMTISLDEAVGRVLDALEEHDLTEDTLLFFLNDNGGAEGSLADNAPFRGHKGTPFEGGLRVPFLVQWPRVLPAGTVYERPVSSLDLVPTALAAAGATSVSEDRDGVNLLPYLTGELQSAPHDTLYWRRGLHWAVRRGDWKLVGLPGQAPQLFELTKDPGEASDRAAERPELVAELVRAHETWSSGLVEPAWRERIIDEQAEGDDE